MKFPLVSSLLFLASAQLQAQTASTRTSLLSRLNPGPPSAMIASSVGLGTDGLLQSVDGNAAWSFGASDGFKLIGQLDFGSTRVDSRSYSRSGISARIGLDRPRLQLFFGGGIAAGTGAGPRQNTRVHAIAIAEGIVLSFNSNWLSGAPLDSVQPMFNRFTTTRRYTDVEAGGRRAFRRLRGGITAGQRFGLDEGDSWLNAHAALRMSERFDLLLAGGERPERPELGQPAGRYFEVGLGFRTARIRSDTEPAQPEIASAQFVAVTTNSDGSYTLRVQSNGSKLQLKGDFTDWQIVDMQMTDRSSWTLQFRAVPGVYMFNLRIDNGVWLTPAGLPTADDGYGGQAALLAIN